MHTNVVTTVDTMTAPLTEVFFPSLVACNINQVNNKLSSDMDLCGFVSTYHPVALGLNLKHTIYAFSIWIAEIETAFDIGMKKDENYQKEAEIGPYLKNNQTVIYIFRWQWCKSMI